MVCGQGVISGICRGGRTFGDLCLQGQPDGSSDRNISDGSCTEEVTREGGAIFEVGFKFADSEARK